MLTKRHIFRAGKSLNVVKMVSMGVTAADDSQTLRLSRGTIQAFTHFAIIELISMT